MSLPDRERAGFDALFNRMAEYGVEGDERFRNERGPLYSFATMAHRLVCFHDGGDIMIVAGYPVGRAVRELRLDALEFAQRAHDDYFQNRR